VTSDPDIGGLESVSDVETPVTHKKLDFKDLSPSNGVELKSTIQTTKDSRRTKKTRLHLLSSIAKAISQVK